MDGGAKLDEGGTYYLIINEQLTLRIAPLCWYLDLTQVLMR